MPKPAAKEEEKPVPPALALVGFDEWLEGVYGFQMKQYVRPPRMIQY